MTQRRTNRCVIVAMLTLSTVSTVLCAKTSLAREEHLELRLSTSQRTLLPCEPLHVVATLHNKTAAQIMPDADEVLSSLLVSHEGGPYRPLLRYGDSVTWGDSSVGPGKSLTKPYVVVNRWPSENDSLIRPGRYLIKAHFIASDKSGDKVYSVESNVLKVTVMSPQRDDRKALDLFKGDHQSALILGLGEERQAVEKLEELLSRHPRSAYAKYALFFLAQRKAARFRSRKPDFGAALKMLKRVVNDYEKFSLTAEAMYQIGQIYRGKYHNLDEAKVWFGRIVKEHPESYRRQDAEKALQYLSQ